MKKLKNPRKVCLFDLAFVKIVGSVLVSGYQKLVFEFSIISFFGTIVETQIIGNVTTSVKDAVNFITW